MDRRNTPSSESDRRRGKQPEQSSSHSPGLSFELYQKIHGLIPQQGLDRQVSPNDTNWHSDRQFSNEESRSRSRTRIVSPIANWYETLLSSLKGTGLNQEDNELFRRCRSIRDVCERNLKDTLLAERIISVATHSMLIRTNSDDPGNYFTRGKLLYDIGLVDEALNDYEKADQLLTDIKSGKKANLYLRYPGHDERVMSPNGKELEDWEREEQAHEEAVERAKHLVREHAKVYSKMGVLTPV